VLHIDENQITDTGMQQIALIKELRSLSMSGTQLSDLRLKECESLTKLKTLIARNTEITGQGVKDLKKTLPKVVVVCQRNP
jgi:hypothetical protein